jgi:GNAT superfamily N-acetyltransferase
MSEFYKLGRTRITDGFALLGFVLGLLLPAYAAGKQMVVGFETGQESRGLTYFVVSILMNAVAGGAIGLLTGVFAGWSWERIHKMLRASRTPSEGHPAAYGSRGIPTSAPRSATMGTPSAGASARGASAGSHPRVSAQGDHRFAPPSPVRYDTDGFSAEAFIALMEQTIPSEYDLARTSAALQQTTNIGAWHGEHLVGAVRVLSDGYLFATIPDIVVLPEFQRQGIGRALMMRALDAASTGVVLFGSPPEAAGFFERLGCQHAPSGYVLKRRVSPEVRTR